MRKLNKSDNRFNSFSSTRPGEYLSGAKERKMMNKVKMG